ncbi:MAG TPA: hypothetical protein VFA22_01460 [Stellaceae bacterium]|nr:hypothetical protein [Stellaceae bacterium]
MTEPKPIYLATADLVTLADALVAVLERETALVRAMQIAEIAPLQAEKSQLTQRFKKALAAFEAADPATLAGSARTRWLAAGQRLAAAAMANERALRVGRAATERLVAAIVTAVRQSRRHSAGYAPRRAALGEPSVAGLAIDHRL